MKKRLIFTLLYERGNFVLSRNFRTQKIGDITWLNSNYNFSKVAQHIDELILINISRDPSFDNHFRKTLAELLQGVFVPLTVGGGIRQMNDVESLFASGADKILVNHGLHYQPDFVRALSEKYGQQAIVGSIDVRNSTEGPQLFTDKGGDLVSPHSFESLMREGNLGEIYINSIDRDGTGNGLDLSTLDMVKNGSPIPIILAGGAGKPAHLIEALSNPVVSAVATANLLNFVGDGLRRARKSIRDAGIELATWAA